MKKTAIINWETPGDIQANLKKLDIEPVHLPLSDKVEKPIAGHPDLQLFIFNNKAYCNPHIDIHFLRKIENKIEIIICETELKNNYPEDIAYNIALVGDFAIHKVDCMEKKIKKNLVLENIKLLNTNQGYSKCSTLTGKNCIITSDKSIYDSVNDNDIKSLLISPGYVDLPGYKYGFIGGASGNFEDTILLTGTLVHHPDYDRIMEFFEKNNLQPEFLSKNKIIDLGTIFVID